jgi:hypothetical protein
MDRTAFTAALFRWDGPNAWTFVSVPDAHAPLAAGAFGRAPVRATVDGLAWDTSVWRDRRHGWLLAVPRRIRGTKEHGDEVVVRIGPRS